jgi:hypothetical protein
MVGGTERTRGGGQDNAAVLKTSAISYMQIRSPPYLLPL